jgi:hypothetical protein
VGDRVAQQLHGDLPQQVGLRGREVGQRAQGHRRLHLPAGVAATCSASRASMALIVVPPRGAPRGGAALQPGERAQRADLVQQFLQRQRQGEQGLAQVAGAALADAVERILELVRVGGEGLQAQRRRVALDGVHRRRASSMPLRTAASPCAPEVARSISLIPSRWASARPTNWASMVGSACTAFSSISNSFCERWRSDASARSSSMRAETSCTVTSRCRTAPPSTTRLKWKDRCRITSWPRRWRTRASTSDSGLMPWTSAFLHVRCEQELHVVAGIGQGPGAQQGFQQGEEVLPGLQRPPEQALGRARHLRAEPEVRREQEQALAHRLQDRAVFLVHRLDGGVRGLQAAQELEQDEGEVQQRQHDAGRLHHAQRAGPRGAEHLRLGHEVVGDLQQPEVVRLAVGEGGRQLPGAEAVLHQGQQLLVIGLPEGVDPGLEFASARRGHGRQEHRPAVAAGNGLARLEGRVRQLEDPRPRPQLRQRPGLVGPARRAGGVELQQGAGDALRHVALASREVDRDGVLGDLERGVEVQHQHAQVEQQEQGDRDDDLAVLAEGKARTDPRPRVRGRAGRGRTGSVQGQHGSHRTPFFPSRRPGPQATAFSFLEKLPAARGEIGSTLRCFSYRKERISCRQWL